MKEVVERAYSCDGCCKELLVDWLIKNGYPEEANILKDMAKTYYNQKLN